MTPKTIEKVHGIEKPFSCSICHEVFSKLNSLGYHVESVHAFKKSSENHSDPNSIVDQSELNCKQI